MDVRIGLADSPRELTIELADSSATDDIKATVDAAVTSGEGVMWLTDKRGREHGIVAAKIAYIEIGGGESEPRIGFGTS